jgi:hypothetical protein
VEQWIPARDQFLNRFGGNQEDRFAGTAVYAGMSVKIAFDAQRSDEASRNSTFREASE